MYDVNFLSAQVYTLKPKNETAARKRLRKVSVTPYVVVGQFRRGEIPDQANSGVSKFQKWANSGRGSIPGRIAAGAGKFRMLANSDVGDSGVGQFRVGPILVCQSWRGQFRSVSIPEWANSGMC